MKRVLCIVSSMNRGGAETFLMKVRRCLIKENYQMDFIVNMPGTYDAEIEKTGGRVFNTALRTSNPCKAFSEIKSIVKNNNYYYVLKCCDTPIGFFDLLAAKIGGAKRIGVRSCNAFSEMSGIRRLVCKIIRKQFNSICSYKIAPSEKAAKFTFGEDECSKGQVFLLNNGIDLNKFVYSDIERCKIRETLGLSDNIVIGHIGRFSHQKNHSFLIDVFSEIHKINSNTTLILIGDGELKGAIKEKVNRMNLSDNVIFAGEQDDIPGWLSAFDCLLMPSLFEGMPNVVIEAQAIGIPCIASDIITEECNITGDVRFLSLEDAAFEWATEILLVAQKRKISDNTRVFIDKKYDIESVTQQFTKIVFGDEK